MVRALAYGAKSPQIEITFDRVSRKLSLFTQQQMGIQLSSELGEGSGGKGRGDGHHPSHAVPVTHVEL